MRSRRLLTMPACWLLLAACCVWRCVAFRYNQETLASTLDQFSSSFRNIALLLPMELTLSIRGPILDDYSTAVNLLVSRMMQRRDTMQRFYFSDASVMGFVVSKTRRIGVNARKFTLYYYAAYIGTNHMRRLTNFLRDFCNTKSEFTFQCHELVSLPSVVRYNIMQLASFKYVRTDIEELSDMFTEFTRSNSTRKHEFVVAQKSQAHDVHQLLCKNFLQCYANRCNVGRVMVTRSEFDLTQWDAYDAAMNKSLQSSATGTEKVLLESLSLKRVFNDSFKASQEDFGLYRCWCENLGLLCASASPAIVLACAAVLLLTLL